MIPRRLHAVLRTRLAQFPVVALLGSRQVGKTTLALALNPEKPCHYLDLERPSDLAKLADPELYLSGRSGQLIILDEIQRLPGVFPALRSLVDERRRAGEKSAHFLLLGSASPELLRQSSETLAGRISFLELPPLQWLELDLDPASLDSLWFRGGYPDSYLAGSDDSALQWCADFLTSYVERDLPQLGAAALPTQLRRFCTMLAHQQGATVNFSQLGNALGFDAKTVRRYHDLLEGLYLLRSLPAWSRNTGKRLVKSANVFWRDSGLLHQLLGLRSLEHVLGHPIAGHSWEGFCIEQILNILPAGNRASHYRTHAGAEVDLVLEFTDGEVLAIEIKRSLSPKLGRAFHESMNAVGASRGIYLMPKGESFPLSNLVEAMSLSSFLTELSRPREQK